MKKERKEMGKERTGNDDTAFQLPSRSDPGYAGESECIKETRFMAYAKKLIMIQAYDLFPKAGLVYR